MKTTKDLEAKIIEAAKELFVERGFEETSMSDIAAKAGINRPTLHYYFRTKDKMFQAVFGSLVETILPKIREIFISEESLTEKISKILDQYFSIFLANPSLPKFILSEVQRDINHLIVSLESLNFDVYMGTIEQMILKEMEAGRIKKVPISVIFLTFYSQITFPFLAKNMLKTLFLKDEKAFKEFLPKWKQNILNQMENLLLP